jgi:hypothetical protein
MKHLLFFGVVFLSACSPAKNIVSLKGNYPVTPMIFSSEKSFSKVWDNLIDIFAQQGLSIKIIDRSSGLIISDRSPLLCTIESSDGKLSDGAAEIVVPYYISNAKRVPVTNPLPGAYATQKQLLEAAAIVTGEWNVRVKSDSTGGSIINVNITNVSYGYYSTVTKSNSNLPLTTYKSTGKFEKMIANVIK